MMMATAFGSCAGPRALASFSTRHPSATAASSWRTTACRWVAHPRRRRPRSGEVTWVKGSGEIGRRNTDRFSGMLQRVVITHLTDTTVSSQPTSDPLSGGTKLEDEHRDEAGHRVWVVTWTKAITTSFIVDTS